MPSVGSSCALTALSALQQWHADNQPALQVAGARAWQESRAKDLAANNIATLQYDWYMILACACWILLIVTVAWHNVLHSKCDRMRSFPLHLQL